jgi:hypothetical protein
MILDAPKVEERNRERGGQNLASTSWFPSLDEDRLQ